MAAQVSKRQQQRNEQILHGLLKEPGNGKCADCFAPNPSWASYNLGIFLCTRCAAVHRKIGTHISKTKSLTLDKWTPEQISMMRSTGNTLSNQKYNALNKPPPPCTAENDTLDLERFIRAKYERKSFMHTPQTKNLPPSPSFHGDPDKIVQILGPPARSPSLQSSASSSAGGLRPGGQQRVSGESFERDRSPASTNSSFDLQGAPPPKTIRGAGANAGVGQSDPWAWTGLDNLVKGGHMVEQMPAVAEGVAMDTQSSNPFGMNSGFGGRQGHMVQEQQELKGISFPPPPQTSLTNPFNPPEMSTSHSLLNLQRSETLASPEPQPLYPQSSNLPLQSANAQVQQGQSFQTMGFQPSLQTFSQTNGMMVGQTPHTPLGNPFMGQTLVQGPPAHVHSPPITPTNPFFLPPQQQQQQPQQSQQQGQQGQQPPMISPGYQAQGQQLQLYPAQIQGQQYPTSSQPQQIFSPPPPPQPQQVYPPQQQQQYQSPSQGLPFQPSQQLHPQPQYQSQQPQFQQQPYQPQPPPSFQPSAPFHQQQQQYQFQPPQSPRMDKQSILNLFNTPSSHPSPPIIQQSGQWNSQVQNGW